MIDEILPFETLFAFCYTNPLCSPPSNVYAVTKNEHFMWS